MSEAWLGTKKRQKALQTIMDFIKDWCPMDYDELAAKLSFYTGISLFKIKYDYLEVLEGNGFIKINNGVVEWVKKPKPIEGEAEKSG